MIATEPYKGDSNEPEQDDSIKNSIYFFIYTLPITLINYAIIFFYFGYYWLINKEFRNLGYRLAKGEITDVQVKETTKKIIETHFWISFTAFNKLPKNKIVVSSFVYVMLYCFYGRG